MVQEQHADRAALYKQWRQLDWPILVDSLNLLDFKAVPIPYAIDEAGVIQLARRFRGDALEQFVDAPPAKPAASEDTNRVPLPEVGTSLAAVEKGETNDSWRANADACYLDGKEASVNMAIAAYRLAIEDDADDARAHFRLGVALRHRYEAGSGEPGDAQRALDAWSAALALDPNQYIWRRRIQQYGPRLAKPYNFYFWVEEARRDIAARGETPYPLVAEPTGSEIVGRGGGDGATSAPPNPDPDGKIDRDSGKQIGIEITVAPARVRPGERVRVRVAHAPGRAASWNNEGEDLTISVAMPAGLTTGEGSFVHAGPATAESEEVRNLEFEVIVGADVSAGRQVIPGYALYNVCEKKSGVCRFLRQDFEVVVQVDPEAPKLGR